MKIKKKKAPACWHTTGARKILQDKYSTLSAEEQAEFRKEFVSDIFGSALILIGLIVACVLLLLVG